MATRFTNRIHGLVRGIAGLGLVLFTASCTTLLNASVPSDGYRVVDSIAYGDDPRQSLAIYVPEGLKAPAPVLLFYYGGSWQSGKKEDYRFLGQAFASLGYVVVVADYRVYPAHYFPDFMDDAAKSLVWVHTNIAAHGGDPGNVFVSGHSAGGYMAVMLSLNDTYLKKAGGDRSMIRGTLGIAGPYDFLPLTDKDIIALFSKKPERETQPITYATHPVGPMFLATGMDDLTVAPKNSINLEAALAKVGSPVTLKRSEKISHITIILSVARGFRDLSPLRADMDAFMKANLAPAK